MHMGHTTCINYTACMHCPLKKKQKKERKKAYSIIPLRLSDAAGKLMPVFISVLYHFLKHSPFNYQIISIVVAFFIRPSEILLDAGIAASLLSYNECTLFLN